MALLTTHSSANKYTSEGLSIRYRAEVIAGGAIKVTRYAKKSYSYIGMTREAANECANIKRAQYTTNHIQLEEGESGKTIKSFYDCQATFRVFLSRVGWNCEINVDETDCAVTYQDLADTSELFGTLVRDYDESDTYALTINSFNRLLGKFGISHGEIPIEEVILEWRTSTMTGWQIRSFAVDNEYGTIITPSSTGPGFYRLRWGSDVVGRIFTIEEES